MKINATIKGLIAGLLMVLVGALLTLNKTDQQSGLHYIGYLIYGAAIVWSLLAFARKNPGAKFGALFNQGFRCFISATLVMAIYTFIYWKTHPELVDSIVETSKIERIKTAKDRTPQEIEKEAQNTKKYFIPFVISGVIFSNLLIGAIVTMSAAGALYLRDKRP
ncbi:hypothetical protein GCM10027051_14390 [Niabella terrae]